MTELDRPQSSANESAAAGSPVARFARSNIALFAVLAAVTASFVYGWYFDDSKPRSAEGWADQTVYEAYADALSHFDRPTAGALHYAAGYPILGAVAKWFVQSDPFVLVSYLLLASSVVLLYFGARHLVGTAWTIAFLALLFFWDGVARTFSYASELFAVPWNNQVLFFAVAFYFWLLARHHDERPTTLRLVAVGLVGGLCFVTREETILFVVPATAAYLWLAKATWKQWLVPFAIVAVCYIPQPAIKRLVLGSASAAGREGGYSQILGDYFQPDLFVRNVWETVIDSHHYTDEWNRPALLQAAPWLWLAPLGMVVIFVSGTYHRGVKLFVLLSLLVMGFYLSGVNMSGQKLQFHTLRYITSSFIMLNFAVVALAKFVVDAVRNPTDESGRSPDGAETPAPPTARDDSPTTGLQRRRTPKSASQR